MKDIKLVNILKETVVEMFSQDASSDIAKILTETIEKRKICFLVQLDYRNILYFPKHKILLFAD